MTAPPLTADPAKLAVRLQERAALGPRTIIGLCGAPGAGKSTLAGMLVRTLNAIRPGCAVAVGMDGFHLAASVIEHDERRDRRGAPDTFDPHGYAALLRRLRENTEPVVYAPQYRREIEDPIAGAVAVPRDCTVVITEGNYLLLPDPAWVAARGQVDEVWFLLAPTEEQRVARLIARHEHFGKSPEVARRHVLETDERNAVLVDAYRDRANLILRWPAWSDAH